MGLPLRRQVAGASTTRRLFVIYALVSVVPVLLLGTCLLMLTNRQAAQRGLSEGAAEARLAARSSVAPDLGDRPLTATLTPREQRAPDRTVPQSSHNRETLRLRVRDLSGRVVYSADSRDLGTVDDDAIAAAKGP